MRHRILGLQGLYHRLAIDPQRRDLAGGEFEIDGLVLCADDVDLPDIFHGEDLRARILDQIAQLALRQPIAGEGIDVAVDVAEAIVEEWTLDAARKSGLDIADHVAHPHPGSRDVARLGGRQKLDENGGLSGNCLASGIIQRFQFLQLLLDPVGDLPGDFLGGCAGPLGADDHHLDGEVRIFLAAEVQIGEHAGDHEHDHEVPDEGAVLQRPIRQVECLH